MRTAWVLTFALTVLIASASAHAAEKPAFTAPAVDHWAYQPLRVRELPTVQRTTWPRQALDYFVLARLEAAGLEPSPAADRVTLIRRLYYDLLGLPPSPAAIDHFVDDPSPDAYAALVDRILSSPHFGERWGRHWLDQARYADSDGYEKDKPRNNAWRYRDWVIEAINRDLPYDAFTVEQLAGDQLPDATPSQRLATAFHRQTLTNTEGGTDQEEFRVEAVVDRVNTTASVWLGLTVACAQCHDHKYDAISQKEYYQLFAFFNSADESNTNVARSSVEEASLETDQRRHAERVEAVERAIAEVTRKLEPTIADRVRAVRAKLEADPIRDVPLIATRLEAVTPEDQTTTFIPLDDGSYWVEGFNPEGKGNATKYVFEAELDAASITALRLDLLTDERLPKNGPGRADNGNFVLNELRLFAGAPGDELQPVKLAAADASFSQKNFAASGTIDGNAKSGWAVSPKMGSAHHALFTLDSPMTAGGQKRVLRVELDQNHGDRHTLGRFRLSAISGDADGRRLAEVAPAALTKEAAAWSAAERSAVLHWALSEDPEGSSRFAELEALKKAEPKLTTLSVRVLHQRDKPRTTKILHRGDFLQPREEVHPATLAVLPKLQGAADGDTASEAAATSDRLRLSTWLVSDENPLPARVAANRIWSHLFGRGLVATVNDFGVRGEAPSHPALLDALAHSYRRGGWSRKAFLRTIVTSATYRQASIHRTDGRRLDPENLLLHRQNRFRVEAEIVRDLTLAASGLLSRRVGGASVFPPMPPGIAELSYAGNFKWATSQGGNRYRRGLYTFFKRTSPHPTLLTFDCPDSNTTCAKRMISNTPLQALTTLNNEVYAEAARALARRVMETSGQSELKSHPSGAALDTDSVDERLAHAFRLCVGRHPSAAELEELRALLSDSRRWFAAQPKDAAQYAGVAASGGENTDTDTAQRQAAEAAAWTATVRVLLNLDEFLTRE